MNRYQTPYDVANTARMMRDSHKGTILIVEGSTDLRVYKNFVDDSHCKLISSNGKDNAIGTLNILENDNFKGFLVIVDADFWTLESVIPSNQNLLLTDTHDLETLIISSDAFEKILSGFVNDRKIRKFNKPVRELILESALIIGLFRWLSSPSKDNSCLDFKGIKFEDFIDKKKLDININKLISEVKKNSQNFGIDTGKIKSKLMKLKNKNYDPWQVCSGHDYLQILFIGLKNSFGNKRARDINSVDALAEIVRISYDYSCFCLTKLHKSIETWEKSNSPFKVLKNS